MQLKEKIKLFLFSDNIKEFCFINLEYYDYKSLIIQKKKKKIFQSEKQKLFLEKVGKEYKS